MLFFLQTERKNVALENPSPLRTVEVQQLENQDEITSLKRSSWSVIIFLLLLEAGSIVSILLGLDDLASDSQPSVVLLARLCVTAGLAGSAVSALISAADRLSNGWELGNGKKVPESPSRPNTFVQRMVPWFLIRPFLGAAMGLAVYLSLSTRLIAETGNSTTDNIIEPRLSLVFVALLAGLFAKKFLESLRKAFDTFVGG